MADEQTADFFSPPQGGDFTAFSAPPTEGQEVFGYSAPPASLDEQTSDFFNPPVEGDAPILLGGGDGYEAPPSYDAPTGYEAPPDATQESMGFAAAPGGGATLIEDVDDEEDAADASPAGGAIIPVEQSPMSKWNDEWQATLLRRKDEENSIKAEHVEKARADIAAFQAERERKRESRMAKNRSDEQDKLEAIEADLENDNSWQRVVKMVELNQDSSDSAVDTGRMKDVFVLLKNETGRAEMLSA